MNEENITEKYQHARNHSIFKKSCSGSQLDTSLCYTFLYGHHHRTQRPLYITSHPPLGSPVERIRTVACFSSKSEMVVCRASCHKHTRDSRNYIHLFYCSTIRGNRYTSF